MPDFPPFHRDNTAVVIGRGNRLVFSPEFARWLDMLRQSFDTTSAATVAISLPIGSYPAPYSGAQAAYGATYATTHEALTLASYGPEIGAVDVSGDYPAPCDDLTFAEYTT